MRSIATTRIWRSEAPAGVTRLSRPRLVRRALAIAGLGFAAAVTVACNSKPVRGPDVSGEWVSGGTVFSITTNGTRVTAKFTTVGPEGETLGFKTGEVSFEGTRTGNFIQGEQLIRYPAENPCYKPNGRRVPFMAMISSNGRQIVLDWYNVTVHLQTCQDLGRAVAVTVLDRRGG